MGCSEAEGPVDSCAAGRGRKVLPFCAALFISIAAAASAQTSSSLVRRNPGSQYDMVKQAMLQLFATGVVQSPVRDGEPYDLALFCQDFYQFAGNTADMYDREPVIRTLAMLALKIVVLRHDLGRLGYPETLWSPIVDDFENTQLRLLLNERGRFSFDLPSHKHDETAMRRIGASLNNYRKQANPSLRPLTYKGGCGAGEFEIRVFMEPGDGRLLFIPAFFYQLCRAQQLDPNNTDRCDRWHEALNGQLSWVAGDYYYIARWPGGAIRQGRLSFTNLKEGQIVVFRKP